MMENGLLKELYHCFYIPPEFSKQKEEMEESQKELMRILGKSERRLVLRIIDAQDCMIDEISLDSFIAGFELAWKLSNELYNDENGRSDSCKARRLAAGFDGGDEETKVR